MAGQLIDMDRHGNTPPTPEDARKATQEQRELQEQLDHQHDDPHGPGLHETRRQIADET